jgi:hypothetical protein
VLLRTAISVAVLWLGWLAYRSLMWLKRAPRVSASDSGLYVS